MTMRNMIIRSTIGALCALAITGGVVSAADLPGKGVTVSPLKGTPVNAWFQHLVVQIGLEKLGYEVAEQLGWQAPAHCVVPSASGSMFTKIWKGLHEFEDLGLIPKVNTHMHMTQAEGCSPIAKAYEAGTTHVRPVKPNTVAKSLAIGNPADGYYSLKTIEESAGDATIVPEDEIVEGIQLLAENEGIFTETAGGVVISGLKRLAERGAIKRDEVTVAYITGNGLKTLEAVEGVVKSIQIAPTMSAFHDAIPNP